MKITWIAFTFAFAFAADAASASVVEYENEERPDFFAAAGGEANVSTVDFTGYPDFTPITDQWSHLGVNFSSSGSVVTSGPGPTAFPNDLWGARGEPEINITFDAPIHWIAADLPGNMVIELYSNDVLFYTSGIHGGGGGGNFGGLISDLPFDSVRIYDDLDSIVAIDDLFFGPPIPAPATLAPLALLFLPRRRRNLRTSSTSSICSNC